MEEGVDTVGNGVLLLFRRQDFFGDVGWRRVLTQLVTECCCCLEDKTFFENLGWRRLLTQLVTGCCCYLEDESALEILGGGGC